MVQPLTSLVRRLLAGNDCSFRFHRREKLPDVAISSAHLYIHVPFCKNSCPYCPYYKEAYNAARVAHYARALCREIDIVRDRFGTFEIPSVYLGGGTPALLGDALPEVLNHLRNRFGHVAKVAIELRPEDCTANGLMRLKDSGVTQASIGIQTFQPGLLHCIGRSNTKTILLPALERLRNIGLEAVNADMMFALPGQTMRQLEDDARLIAESGVDQVTCYPLFTFPYTPAGQYLRKNKLKMPSLNERRRQYNFLWEFYTGRDFTPASVWSFLKGNTPRFSSVTRETYIGLGAGAATHVPGHFWFNPFNVRSHIAAVSAGNLAGSLHMPMPGRLSALYWLYWRLYETSVPQKEFRERFPHKFSAIRLLMSAVHAMGMSEHDGERIRLNRRGAFWIHLAQNYFLLSSINSLWREAIRTPYPEQIDI